MLLNIRSWSNVLPVVKSTFYRFPLPFVFTLLATLLALLLVHKIDAPKEPFIGKLFFLLAYGVVALTALKLFVESEHWPLKKHLVAAVITITIIYMFIWPGFVPPSGTTFVFFSLAVLLSLLFSPYLKRLSDSASVWFFNYQAVAAVFFGVIAVIILGVGVSFILLSIRYLFEIKISSDVYRDMWILFGGIFLPIYVLSNIPRQFDYKDNGCDFPKGVSFIANYILVPLMFVYIAILYAYFIKIIVQWELPRGNLGWMITTFGTIGIVTKLVAYPIRDKGTRLLLLFDKYYYYALVVPVILLAIAIGVRINDYGMTEQRYAVLLLGAWFVIVASIAMIQKDRFHIKYVPIVLAILSFFASFGPWGAVDVSNNSQASRFEKMLLEHKLFENGQAVKLDGKLGFAERRALSSMADYLTKNKNRIKYIRPWFENIIENNREVKLVVKRHQGGKSVAKLLGFDYVRSWDVNKSNDQFYYKQNINLGKVMINVSGFDFIARSYFYMRKKDKDSRVFGFTRYNKKGNIIVKLEGERYIVIISSGDRAEFDLGKLVRALRKDKADQVELKDATKLVLTTDSFNEQFKVRLILEKIRGEVINDYTVDLESLNFVIMLKFYK